MCGIRPRRARQLSCVLASLLVLTGAEGLTGMTAQTPVDPVASTLHSRQSAKQTPGTVVTLEEVKREQGRHGTRITYRIATSGFPRAETLRMQISSLAISKPSVSSLGFRPTNRGHSSAVS